MSTEFYSSVMLLVISEFVILVYKLLYLIQCLLHDRILKQFTKDLKEMHPDHDFGGPDGWIFQQAMYLIINMRCW